RFGNADQIEAALCGEAAQDREASIAANSDQRVEPDLVISGDDIVRAILPRAVGHAEIERVALARGAQDGAAEAQEIAGKVGQMQLLAAHRARHEAPGAFMNSKDLPAITKDGPVDHRADDGIQ